MAKSRTPPPATLILRTPAEAADIFRVSEDTVYRLIEDGELRPVDIARPGAKRSVTRIRSDDIDAFIEARTRGSGTRAAAPDAAADGHPGPLKRDDRAVA